MTCRSPGEPRPPLHCGPSARIVTNAWNVHGDRMQQQAHDVFRWTTDSVAPAQKLDTYVGLVCEQFLQMTTSTTKRGDFHSALAIESLGELRVATMGGDTQDSRRTIRDISRTKEHAYHLLVSTRRPWTQWHQGSTMQFAEGDVVLVDTRHEHGAYWLDNCEAVNVRMPIEWLRTWIDDPRRVVGKRIPGDSGWGRVLSLYIQQLSPERGMPRPIAETVMADQIGALVALASTQMPGSSSEAPCDYPTKRRQIVACIHQRCVEQQLVAADVAQSVGLSVRTLHRILAAAGETFGQHLVAARADVALRMLQSSLFDRLTSAEVAARAGFLDASHFAKVFRRRFGSNPSVLRSNRASGRTR